MKWFFILIAVTGFTFPAFTLASDRFNVILELGASWQHRNDVKINPDTGTYFEFDQYDPGPFFHYRTEAYYHFNERHALRAVYAPLEIEVTGTPDRNIQYDGQVFSANQPLTVNYQFNSYRLGYVYTVYNQSPQIFKVGITGKIRDAFIELRQGALQENYDNVGFVPLLYFAYQFQFHPVWHFYSDLDFAAAPQGRAIDLALKLRRQVRENAFVGLGYRTLEGGADNDKVFTFSWFSYAVLDVVVAF